MPPKRSTKLPALEQEVLDAPEAKGTDSSSSSSKPQVPATRSKRPRAVKEEVKVKEEIESDDDNDLEYEPGNDASEKPSAAKKKKSVSSTVVAASNQELDQKPGRVDRRRVRFETRVHCIRKPCKTVTYWMNRDQRVDDNWALLHAQDLALEHDARLIVCFCLAPPHLHYGTHIDWPSDATSRQYEFMIGGLKDVESQLQSLNIPFYLLKGNPVDEIYDLVASQSCGLVVTDFHALQEPRQWQQQLATKLDDATVPMIVVDAHNIVPVWITSNKAEFAARTIRPKIHRHLNSFLTEFPAVLEQKEAKPDASHQQKGKSSYSTSSSSSSSSSPSRIFESPIDWAAVMSGLAIDTSVKPLDWLHPGRAAAHAVLRHFIDKRLSNFEAKRNDPNSVVSSDLSPYLNFGQISTQRCAMEVNTKNRQHPKSVAAYIEEMVVRRELSDNFCFYNIRYNSLSGAADWAQLTLKQHAKDKREHLYSRQQLEYAVTYDDLWNASQLQLTRHGKMHGFLRMYWAKKILEWTTDAQTALDIALYLNDRYSLDGRDPNGYVGCAWSIIGVHDHGWGERAVFGKIRYMNYAGCKRKFDIKKFVAQYPGATPGSVEFKANQKRCKELSEEEKSDV